MGPVMRETMDMAVVETEGVCTIIAEKGNLVHESAVLTWYASASWTVPAQSMMLFAGSLMKSATLGLKRVSRTNKDVSSCSGESSTTSRNLRSRFAVSRACA